MFLAWICMNTLPQPSYLVYIFTHLKLRLATATHNFKSVKTTHISLIWNKTFAILDV